MKKEVYDKSIATGELQLNGFWTYSTHFSIVFLFALITLVMFGTTIVAVFNGEKDVFQWPVLSVMLVTLVLGLLSYRMQKRRLKFIVVETSLSHAQLHDIIDKVGQELKWRFVSETEYAYIARTNPGFVSGSWGEQITILINNDSVFVNSICDPSKHTSLVSFGRNRENEATLINTIKQAGQ